MDIADYMRREQRSWMPNKEPDQPTFIVGEVVKVTSTTSDYGDTSELVPVVELLPDDDTELIWRITAYPTVLRRELLEQKPRPGDRLGVRYDGETEGAGGRHGYGKYRVMLERTDQPAPEIDWDQVERTLGDEPGDDLEQF